MSSKIHPGSLQGTLLATPVSTISNFFKFVEFWVSPGVPKALKLSPDGSPKSTKLSKSCPQKPLQRKLSGTLSLKTPFKRNLHRIWKAPPDENTAIYCTGDILSHAWSRTSFVNFAAQKDDPEASFEPLLHPCGTQKAHKCTPKTNVKKTNKEQPTTFQKVDRLDPTWSSTETESMKQ